MKIRTKLSFLQLIIVGGFLLSIAFVMLRFNQAFNLKRLELASVESITALNELEQKTRLFSGRTEPLVRLWDDWIESFTRFDTLYMDMLNSPYHQLLGGTALTRRDARLEAWSAIKTLEIDPLITEIETVLSDDTLELAGDLGIWTSLVILASGNEPQSAAAEILARINSRFTNLRESMVSSISIPTAGFVTGMRDRMDVLSSTLFITTLIIAVLIQAGGAILGYLFSRRFGANIVLLEQTLARVADGNFGVNLEIRSGDEFQGMAEHFSILTTDLWNRIESMKDMMRDIGSAAGENVNVDELEDFMLELAIDNTGADAGVLMGVDEGMLVLKKMQGYFPPPLPLPPEAAQNRDAVTDWFGAHRIAPGEGLMGGILADGESRFIRDNRSGELPYNADIHSHLYINSAIFIPLNVSGVTLGLLALILTRQDTVFTDLDFAYMRSYGDFIALTIDNMEKYSELLKSQQLNREIEVAADIQKALLPEKLPILSGVEVAAFSDAAKGVSGDYYDVFDLGEGKTAVVICDVAGKGVPASLLMIMIRTIIRSISTPDKRADQILTELNRTVTGRLGADRFATLALVIIDSRQLVVSYANGAHHPLYIIQGDSGRCRMFDADGLPIGIDINASYEHKKIRIQSGDTLVMFTDGLPEARNAQGEELTTDRLLRVVARYAGRPPSEMARRVKLQLDDFTSGVQHDDQTFIALKIN